MITYLCSLCPSIESNTRTNLGPYLGHVHSLKHIRSILFCWRSGHINSNYVHENCPFKEDANHVMCPHFSVLSSPPSGLLSRSTISETVFGLDLSLPDDPQFKIQKAISKFLVETKLTSRIWLPLQTKDTLTFPIISPLSNLYLNLQYLSFAFIQLSPLAYYYFLMRILSLISSYFHSLIFCF